MRSGEVGLWIGGSGREVVEVAEEGAGSVATPVILEKDQPAASKREQFPAG